MSQPYSRISSTGAGPGGILDAAKVRSLIDDLASLDGSQRHSARQSLVGFGKPSVAPLIYALQDPRQDVRWEAANALVEIGDPAAASALVRAMEDTSFGVRWLAAEGLISLGSAALRPLLDALVSRSSSVLLREGAHHVLSILAKRGLRDYVAPVLAVLEDVEPAVQVPHAAVAALDRLGRLPATSS